MAIVRRIPLVLLVLLSTVVAAQSFRGDVAHRVVLGSEGASERRLSAGQVLLIELEAESRRFISGIAIELVTDGPLTSGVLTAHFYAGVDPPGSGGMTNLAGLSLGTVPIGPAPRQRLLVPVSNQADDQTAAGIARLDTADPSIGSIAVQIVPGMKAVDEGSLRAEVRVSIRPELRPVGALIVELDGEDDIRERALRQITLEIDGRSLRPGETIELDPGIYRLVAEAGELLSETVNVGIEQAQVRRVLLQAREPMAQVRLSVPTVADVYWNGSLVAADEMMEVSPGDHSIMIRMGDFSVSRQMTLSANETYEVAIDLDILLNRD